MFSRTRASVATWQELHRPGKSAPRWRRWAARIALATTLATLLAYFPYRLLDGSSARKAEELEHQRQRTLEASRAIAAENTRLRRTIESLRNDVGAIEDIARKELGMVRPGEIIFRIDGGDRIGGVGLGRADDRADGDGDGDGDGDHDHDGAGDRDQQGEAP